MIASDTARVMGLIRAGLTELPVRHARNGASCSSDRDHGVLELLDLACVKINKSKPRQLSLIMYRLQSTNVSIIGIHPPAATRFGDVAGVAAFGRPGLVIFLTVVPQSRPHPFGEGGQAVAVPFLQRVTGERLTGAVALIGENSDLVHQVGMLRPARRDDIGNIPDVLVVQPGHDSLQPRPDLLPQLRRLAGRWVPWPRQVPQISQRQQVILLPAALRDQVLDRPVAPTCPVEGTAE